MITPVSRSVLERAHQVENLGLDRHVERGGRLVGDEQLRVAGERHGDHHALAHAAGELVRILVDALFGVGDADHLQQSRWCRSRAWLLFMPMWSWSASLIWRLIVRTGLSEVIGSWKIIAMSLPRIDAHLLVRHLQDIVALEEDLAGDDLARRAGDQAHDREPGHALAAARLADDAERFARHDVERDIVDRLDDAVLGLELGLEILRLQGSDRRVRLRHCRRLAGALASPLGDHARSSLDPAWLTWRVAFNPNDRPSGIAQCGTIAATCAADRAPRMPKSVQFVPMLAPENTTAPCTVSIGLCTPFTVRPFGARRLAEPDAVLPGTVIVRMHGNRLGFARTGTQLESQAAMKRDRATVLGRGDRHDFAAAVAAASAKRRR